MRTSTDNGSIDRMIAQLNREHARRKALGPVTRLPCGCAYNEWVWIKECDACKAEHVSIHQRAQEDRARTMGAST